MENNDSYWTILNTLSLQTELSVVKKWLSFNVDEIIGHMFFPDLMSACFI